MRKVSSNSAAIASSQIKALSFSRSFVLNKIPDRGDDVIRSNFGSDVIEEFLVSSSVPIFLQRGTAYRSMLYLSLVGILKRRGSNLSEKSIVDSLKILSEIIDRTNEGGIKLSKFGGFPLVFGFLMNKLVALKGGKAEEAYKAISAGPKVMAFIAARQKIYE